MQLFWAGNYPIPSATSDIHISAAHRDASSHIYAYANHRAYYDPDSGTNCDGPDVIPYAELITPNEIAKGATGATIDLWYFIGQQVQVVEIFVSGQGNNITFSLRDETNEGLLSCGSPTGSGCSIKEYMLPYTGLYYIRIDPLLKFNYLNYTVCKNDSLPAFCYQIDSYSLILNFK